ncbi:MAG: lamin tail domain-containing protein [Verrucomicrobiales bacterium]|nr:lamin tail domain-containing protein [Verrucomicrobiales bacterium]
MISTHCAIFSLGLLLSAASATAGVIINEIHYHPVEEAVFDTNGLPVLDLSEDVHEFIELHNTGTTAVDLSRWHFDSGVLFTFPNGSVIGPSGFVVVAKAPSRLTALSAYPSLAGAVYGPYSGTLANGDGETVRLKDGAGAIQDAVPYGATFPWAVGADGFGASERWTGINPLDWQYRGRSLERVSVSHPSADPANWLASPFPGNPSPGKPNAVTRATPLPLPTRVRLAQVDTEAFPIQAGKPARVEITLSGTNELGKVRVDYFVDEINRTNETINSVEMSGTSSQLSATLPGFAPRSIIRYRIMAQRTTADLGNFEQRILPREDDPFAWNGFFVVTNRTSPTDAYDLFASTNTLTQLVKNQQDNPGQGWNPPLGTKPIGRFNLTEPAVLAYRGEIYDVEIRHSGSFYRRDFSRNSFKVELPAYKKLAGHNTILILDKGTENMFGHQLFEALGFPTVRTRIVDLYLNNQGRVSRIEFEENDEEMLQRWADAEKVQNPDQPKPGTGLLYKASGFQVLGPFGPADGSVLPPNEGWTPLERYEWVYSTKNEDWEGYVPLKSMIDEMWAARGPLPATDIPALRAYLTAKWDVARTIDYVAIRAWMSVRDDTYHNHMEWRQSNGLWTMVPWDFDGELTEVTSSIFNGENGNWFKDNIFKAFREEYKQRLWWLNNTALHPDTLAANGLTHANLITYAPARQQSINDQTFGTFHRPKRPVNVSPTGGESVVGPASLVSSAYEHSLASGSAHTATYWEIRAENGSYRFPVFAQTSQVARTSIAIPFAQLEPGRQYFWRVVHLDGEGHPSIVSQESSFRYGGNFRRLQLIGIDDSWKYDDSGTNYTKVWRENAFDDSSWKQGAGLFGVSTSTLTAPIKTPLPLGFRTYYFRKSFTLPADPQKVTLRVRHYLDDGAVYYLNGAEALRVNVSAFFPIGALPPTQTASRDIPDATFELPLNLPTTNLVTGENLIAVQVHQRANASPDVVFGAQLEVTVETGTGTVRLNELMAFNQTAIQHGATHPNWIELVNASNETADLAGTALTIDPATPAQYVFPADTLLGPKSHLVVWCNPPDRPAGFIAPIQLSPGGGGIWLYSPDGQGGWIQQDSIRYGLQPPNYSIGRIADTEGVWTLTHPTPGQVNQSQALGSLEAVRVNEWMANPSSGPDWFELFNPQLAAVAVSGCYLSDSANQPTNTQLPALSFLAPWSFTRFQADSDPEQGADHVRFRLSGSGESILLYDPAGKLVDSVTFGPQTDGVSEGRRPDGSSTIQKLVIGGTPERTNRGDVDSDGLPDDWEAQYGFSTATDESRIDSDLDGTSNYLEFLAGTDPRNPASVLALTALSEGDPGSPQLLLQASLVPGKVYELQRRQSLEQGPWEVLETVAPTSSEPQLRRTFPLDPGSVGTFYRLILKQG